MAFYARSEEARQNYSIHKLALVFSIYLFSAFFKISAQTFSLLL